VAKQGAACDVDNGAKGATTLLLWLLETPRRRGANALLTNASAQAVTRWHPFARAARLSPANTVLRVTRRYPPSRWVPDKMSEDAKFALGY